MTLPDIPTSEVLERAADFIEKRGWIRGTGVDWDFDPGPICLEGGIYAALGIRPAEITFESDQKNEITVTTRLRDENIEAICEVMACPAYRAVYRYLREHDEAWAAMAEKGQQYLFVWNDKIAENQQHVLDTLRTVAKQERIKEEAAA